MTAHDLGGAESSSGLETTSLVSGKWPLPSDGMTVASVPADHATCRYIADAGHTCATSTGAPLREHQTCRAEASAQLADLLAARARADADLARQDQCAAAADARLTACERWGDDAA